MKVWRTVRVLFVILKHIGEGDLEGDSGTHSRGFCDLETHMERLGWAWWWLGWSVGVVVVGLGE